MKKSLLALAVTLVAASGANAAWETGYDPAGTTIANTYGNGEAAFQAWDNVRGVSYVLDLGVRYNDLVSGAAFNNQSFNLDLSVFSTSAAGDVNWQIVAGSGNKRNAANTAADFTNYGAISTVDAGTTSINVAGYNSAIIQQQLGRLNAARTLLGDYVENPAAGTYAQNNATTESSAFGTRFLGGTDVSFFQNTTGNDTAGDISGETLNLWKFGFGTASSNKIASLLGSVTLSGSSLTLNGTTAPEVPVPAAVWLLGSALAGLGGIARRRNQSA